MVSIVGDWWWYCCSVLRVSQRNIARQLAIPSAIFLLLPMSQLADSGVAWLSRQYKADQFTNSQTLRHSTDALRVLIAVLYSLCSALSCVILYLSIKGSFTPSVSYMIAVIALCIPLFVHIAQRLEKKFFSRWPEYFAEEYADRWGVDAKWVMRDDAPSRPI